MTTGRVLACVLLICAGACGSNDAPARSAPPTTAPATVAIAPTPAPAPVPAPTVATADSDEEDEDDEYEYDGPAGAYRAAMDAFDDGNASAYFGAFLDTLECFHGRAAVPLADVHRARDPRFLLAYGGGVYIASLDVLASEDDRVVLLDRGAYWSALDSDMRAHHGEPGASADALVGNVHEKIIVMRRVGDRWRIAAETDRAHAGCIDPPVTLPAPSAMLEACRTSVASCLHECDGVCDDCGSCNDCSLCPSSCIYALGQCVGAGEDFCPI